MLETLDYTIRIGSTLPTQHTTFIFTYLPYILKNNVEFRRK